MLALRTPALRALWPLGPLAALVVLLAAGSVRGADFCVDNRVYAEGTAEPISRSTTVFREGQVYDFLQEPEEIIVFDKPAEKFVMLDVRRRVRTELPGSDVLAFTRRLKLSAEARAEAQQDPFLRFSAAPKFEVRVEETAGELRFSSPWMTYRVLTTVEQDRSIAAQYREFADWLAQLNALLSPGSRLPFARLQVNQALAERGMIPREVRLTIAPRKAGAKPVVMRSEHRLGRALPEADLRRIEQARQFMEGFSQVPLERYRQGVKR